MNGTERHIYCPYPLVILIGSTSHIHHFQLIDDIFDTRVRYCIPVRVATSMQIKSRKLLDSDKGGWCHHPPPLSSNHPSPESCLDLVNENGV
jgi:hypothetical protein